MPPTEAPTRSLASGGLHPAARRQLRRARREAPYRLPVGKDTSASVPPAAATPTAAHRHLTPRDRRSLCQRARSRRYARVGTWCAGLTEPRRAGRSVPKALAHELGRPWRVSFYDTVVLVIGVLAGRHA